MTDVIETSSEVEERPRYLTPEIAIAAAKEIVAELIRVGELEDSEAERSIADIARVGRTYMDGYELAKTLDDRCHWACNFTMAETLEGFSSVARNEIEKAQKAWVERNKIEPQHPTGTRVRFGSERGTIDGVYEYGPAQYLIKVDGDAKADGPANSRRIVNFEDVTPLAKSRGIE